MEASARTYLEGQLSLAQVPEVLAWLVTPEGEAFTEQYIHQALDAVATDSDGTRDEEADRLFTRISSQLEVGDQCKKPIDNAQADQTH